jgi:hypothetical protein
LSTDSKIRLASFPFTAPKGKKSERARFGENAR